MMRKASYAAVDRPPGSRVSKPPIHYSPRIVEDLRTRNLKLAASIAQLRDENLRLQQQLRLYKRRSVILREQNALLLAKTKESLSGQQPTLESEKTTASKAVSQETSEPFTPIDACTTKPKQTKVKRPIVLKKKTSGVKPAVPPLTVRCFETDMNQTIPTTPFLDEDRVSTPKESRSDGTSILFDTGSKGESRPVRKSVSRVVYKEPSLVTKVRKGHQFFKTLGKDEEKKSA